jgi:hypothetical protein
MPAGRPRKQVDEQQIESLAGIGCTIAEIAAVSGVSKDTLERNYAALIEKGREHAKSSLRRMQFKSAEAGNVTMQIWLGKQLLGQKDHTVQENTGRLPIQLIHSIPSPNREKDGNS